VSVPFIEAMDARHHFQGADWQRDMFKRREESKDVFLQLLREFQVTRRGAIRQV
jgi:hypothetical protein